MAEHDIENVRERLIGQRSELLRLAAATESSRQPVQLDQTTVGRVSRMDAVQQQAMALEAERRRGLELRRIEAALRRIEKGEYGICVSCGEEIAPKRLDLDPTVPTCVKCARSAEA
ncbi:MAG TPA: TraR/DksA family transcriptional regulator [Stellaceae bacterium]|nr:TraR/DksA family transcriptional regulator [Stellaceae bacterium]